MISLIIHGGAWKIPDNLLDEHRAGCRAALEEGWAILRSGGSAVDAVEKAVMFMENYSIFDAGSGSHLNADGEVELDAGLMDGKTFRCGAVAAVKRIRNPIAAARKVMDNCEHILLVGPGAERFAGENGISLCDGESLVSDRELNLWKAARGKKKMASKDAFSHSPGDTVGAVAFDHNQNIAVGTSTGGTLNKFPGRVGDSPLIGCGLYAENGVGGVSTTGWGEGMIKVALAKTIVDILRHSDGNPQAAADAGIDILQKKVDGRGGVIVLNNAGEIGVAFNTPRMAYAYLTETMGAPFISV